jgi:hypothetical protein
LIAKIALAIAGAILVKLEMLLEEPLLLRMPDCFVAWMSLKIKAYCVKIFPTRCHRMQTPL